MTDDAKKVLAAFADGSLFGPTAVQRVLGCPARRASRAIRSLEDDGMARIADRGRRRIYRLTPRGRDLGHAAAELTAIEERPA
ncbi:hypothetical protein [Candidatus Palauibacter sp.]|uniref:hypothetical protein n=1 Tax=Candidatus Palauibacter sp. TaxID=3101350 RepID=UPI003AF2B8D2